MRNTEILSALFETTRTLGLNRDLDALLTLVLERARDLTGFDHCALMLVDRDSGELAVRSVAGFDARREEIYGLRLARGQGLAGWAVEHRTPLLVPDVSKDERYIEGLEGARSNLVVPLILENEVVGVLNVESRQVDAFDDRDAQVLTVLGTQAALAILASQARTSLERRVAQLDALYHISGLNWTDKGLGDLAGAVVQEVARLAPSASCALLLLNRAGNALELVAHVGYDDSIGGIELSTDRGVVGRCARTGEVQVVRDVRQDPDYVQGMGGAVCEVALPLDVRGRIIGVLDVESPVIDSVAADQVRTLGMIAQQVAAVMETARLQEERLELIHTDTLTGLANRRHFDDALARSLNLSLHDGRQLSLLVLDLDHFKAINDRHGHDAGDRVLAGVAARLQELVRLDDLLARIGGEEFAVIVRGAGPTAAVRLAERLRRAVEELEVVAESERPLPVTVSIGMASLGPDMNDPVALFRAADRALYRAKDSGRNRVAVAD